MDTRTSADMDPYIDRALSCLIEGAQNRTMRSSTSNFPDEKEQILRDLNLLELSYERLYQRTQRHIIDLSRRLNAQALYHLPNELLVKIFALALTIDCVDYADPPRSIIRLSLGSKN
ncbi:hypothetical protein FRB94_003509 [Tulasnella sp. JGI-2019a]|nr:hypothetical protein FRB94_003509 [Tulasnella sp. JGI-2019a]